MRKLTEEGKSGPTHGCILLKEDANVFKNNFYHTCRSTYVAQSQRTKYHDAFCDRSRNLRRPRLFANGTASLRCTSRRTGDIFDAICGLNERGQQIRLLVWCTTQIT